MADLINVDDLIEALGRDPESPTEETQWGHYITKVSTYINSQCAVSFTPFNVEDEKHQADYYGVVSDLTLPITAVTSVKRADTSAVDPNATWDHNALIYNLCPNQVVLVSYSGGKTNPPDDIRMVAIDSVVELINGPSNDGLLSYQIGDVVERYKSPTVADVVEELGADILDRYRAGEGSWHLGSGWYPNGVLPIVN